MQLLIEIFTAHLDVRSSAVQGAEVKVCKGLLLLRREDEGFGWRREDRLEPSELAVKVADVH